ncbi:MAG TPA: hypothetical protein VGL99_03210 [Chloroflexota bacterium]
MGSARGGGGRWGVLVGGTAVGVQVGVIVAPGGGVLVAEGIALAVAVADGTGEAVTVAVADGCGVGGAPLPASRTRLSKLVSQVLDVVTVTPEHVPLQLVTICVTTPGARVARTSGWP